MKKSTQPSEAERTITILYFAELAKRLGLKNETISLPEDIVSIGDLIPWLMTRRGEWEKALACKLKTAVNRRFVEMTYKIRNGDEIALVTDVGQDTKINFEHFPDNS